MFSFVSAINRLFSAGNQLTGTLPAALGDLTNLVELMLCKSFELPRTWYNMFRIPNAIIQPTNTGFLCCHNQLFIFRGKSAYRLHSCAIRQADEFEDSGGLSLAAELGASSADHVGHSNDEARSLASKSGTMQTFLPGTPYVLGFKDYPPIADCVQNDWAFSLATDFNPNCWTLSIPFIGSLAAHSGTPGRDC